MLYGPLPSVTVWSGQTPGDHFYSTTRYQLVIYFGTTRPMVVDPSYYQLWVWLGRSRDVEVLDLF